eukprot:XP_001709887.1 Hypothetical protein GL50803_32489 [Giardia lamblia ATCC 50803]
MRPNAFHSLDLTLSSLQNATRIADLVTDDPNKVAVVKLFQADVNAILPLPLACSGHVYYLVLCVSVISVLVARPKYVLQHQAAYDGPGVQILTEDSATVELRK